MSELIRFGVSIEKDLLTRFDKLISKENYPNRSEAFRDLMRDKLVDEEWEKGAGEVAGVVTLVYDHHKRDVRNLLEDVQHDHHGLIVSGQHIHLDHDNCLEIIVLRGESDKVRTVAGALKSIKGVKHGQLAMATTGKDI
ncbi:MAG: nickel-responsive transcriptional regulator NikR [Candidatus Aadella gelida]|nr:nickel-responsive transcriptional regulator NikR [Candidatus Aadella gelida]